MKANNKFWLFVALSLLLILLIITIILAVFWQQLSPEQKTVIFDICRDNPYFFVITILVLAALAFGLDGIFHMYILPMVKLAEETSVMFTVNPSHRIKIDGSADIVRLVQALNEQADRYERLQKQVQGKIHQAKAQVEKEKNILAVIMSEMPQGVLICNAEGNILLYNRRARDFLAPQEQQSAGIDAVNDDAADDDPETYIGLGRSIFSILDKHLIVHALEEIAEKLERKEGNAVSSFVTAGRKHQLLRAEALPILQTQRQLTGFIIILTDITRQLEQDSRLNALLNTLIQGIRHSSASIRAAIESILDYPQMAAGHHRQFNQIIHQEALSLGLMLEKASQEHLQHLHSRWPMVRMRLADFLESLKRKAEARLDVRLDLELFEEVSWIKVDSYSLVLAIIFVMNQVLLETGFWHFTIRYQKKDRLIHLDFLWAGAPVKIDTLRQWERQQIRVAGERLPLTLKEVLQQHESALSAYVSSTADHHQAYIRWFLPEVKGLETTRLRALTILPESRPEFYDFDLFHQPGQTDELDDRLLTELAYTVFDTETTGLDPAGGDQIISIGAVRIVNSRLLREDLFDQLVDPQRPLPEESIRIHGIEAELLQNQPTIENVLPRFQRFADRTILVAHNAAFDMRMLQINELKTGVKFINPVLDTMLLSSVVHPNQKDHNIESIAERLGISVVGRHSALGDAIATGEIFLKLLPLLTKRGIYTLKDARTASQKSKYARLKY